MQVSHLWFERQDCLPFQPGQHAEDTVGAGVVGPQVDHNRLGIQIAVPVVGGLADRHIRDGLFPGVRVPAGRVGGVVPPGQLFFVPLVAATGVAAFEGFGFLFVVGLFPVLAQGVAVEPFPGQNAAQVGVAGESDPEEVIDLSLLQIGSGVDAGGGRYGVVGRHADMQAQRVAALAGAVEVVDDVEAFVDPGAVFAFVRRVIDAGDARQEIVLLCVAQVSQQGQQAIGRNEERFVGAVRPCSDDRSCHSVVEGQGWVCDRGRSNHRSFTHVRPPRGCTPCLCSACAAWVRLAVFVFDTGPVRRGCAL